MNIVIIPSWFPSKKDPINGSFFLEQACAIAKLGHKVTVLDASYQGRKDYLRKTNFFVEDKYFEGVRILSLTIPGFGIGRKKNPKYLIYKYRLKKLLKIVMRESKIDIIHSHSYLPSGYIVSKLAREMRIPHVMTEHSSNLIDSSGKVFHDKLLYTINNIDSLICVGEGLKESLRKYVEINDDNCFVIPNIVNSNFKYTNRTETNEFSFLTIGSLIDRKNFERLIVSFKKAFFGNENIKLNIVGSGHLEKKLRELISKEKLEGQVFLKGTVNRNQIVKVFNENNAFVLISKQETFGVVYAEALVTGMPVIGLKNGGAEYIINSDNGILLDNDDIFDVSNALKAVYCNRSTYDYKIIADNASKIYSEESIVSSILEVYKKLIDKGELNHVRK